MRPVLQHTDGSTGVRTVLSTDIAAQVSLRAKILGARPPVVPAQVSWRKGDTVIRNVDRYLPTASSNQTNLTIVEPSMESAGIYTVIVVHEAGNASLQFRLKILGKLCVYVCVCV